MPNSELPETLQVGVGQPLEIPMGPCMARTGYVWMIREIPGCLALESTRDVPPAHPEHGRLPSRVIRLVGCHQGDGLLRCVLAAPWNPGDAIEERRYRVVVRPPPPSSSPSYACAAASPG